MNSKESKQSKPSYQEIQNDSEPEVEEDEETKVSYLLRKVKKHLKEDSIAQQNHFIPQFLPGRKESEDEEQEKGEFNPFSLKLKPKKFGHHVDPPSVTELKNMSDPTEILETLGFKQTFSQVNCLDALALFKNFKFFFNVCLKDYKPLEIFFFNLQRTILIPELIPDNNVKKVVEGFIKDFIVIYEQKKKLYGHLATDSTVLKDCLRHLNLSRFYPDKMRPFNDHNCELFETKYIYESKSLNEDFGSLKTPYFVFGIWEEFFLNPYNRETLGAFNTFFGTAYRKRFHEIWPMANDLHFVKDLYNNLKSAFPDELTKDFPFNECKEALLQMKSYDSNPHLFKIAIVGNNIEKKKKIVAWFLTSTQFEREENSYQMKYEADGKTFELSLYLLSSDDFRVCHFDCIIYSDTINYPNMNADLKHFVRSNLYCNNTIVQASIVNIQFLDFEQGERDEMTWRVLNYITDSNFQTIYKI